MARLAGLFYLLTSGTAFAQFVRSRLVTHDDAVTTAHNIMASEPLYRLAFAANLGGIASYLAVVVLLYVLLKPVGRTIAMLAASFGLVGIATQALASLGYYTPLLLYSGEHYLGALSGPQLQALALASLHLAMQGFNIALVFFGLYCGLLGYLIFRSTYLPRAIGVLMVLAALGLLTNSIATFLSPDIADVLEPVTLGLDAIGELSLMVWLLVMGLNPVKWDVRASRSA